MSCSLGHFFATRGNFSDILAVRGHCVTLCYLESSAPHGQKGLLHLWTSFILNFRSCVRLEPPSVTASSLLSAKSTCVLKAWVLLRQMSCSAPMSLRPSSPSRSTFWSHEIRTYLRSAVFDVLSKSNSKPSVVTILRSSERCQFSSWMASRKA